MVLRKIIDEIFKELYIFQFRYRVQRMFVKQVKIILYHVIAKRVEGVDIHFISIGANERNKPPPHGDSAGICISKTEDIFRGCISIKQYSPDPRGKYLCFTRPWTGNHHYRTFDIIYGYALLLVKLIVFFVEFVLEIIAIGGQGSLEFRVKNLELISAIGYQPSAIYSNSAGF